MATIDQRVRSLALALSAAVVACTIASTIDVDADRRPAVVAREVVALAARGDRRAARVDWSDVRETDSGGRLASRRTTWSDPKTDVWVERAARTATFVQGDDAVLCRAGRCVPTAVPERIALSVELASAIASGRYDAADAPRRGVARCYVFALRPGARRAVSLGDRSELCFASDGGLRFARRTAGDIVDTTTALRVRPYDAEEARAVLRAVQS